MEKREPERITPLKRAGSTLRSELLPVVIIIYNRNILIYFSKFYCKIYGIVVLDNKTI
jgi:hypothetical protein